MIDKTIDDYSLTIDDALQIINNTSNDKFEISVGHEKTENFIRYYGLLIDDVISIIKSIKRQDYIKGPVSDDKPGPTRNKPVWIFKKIWNEEWLYIKLKIFITNRKTYVVSIHIDERNRDNGK